MGGFEHGKATGLYVIIEQIYPKQGLPSIANTIGPNLIQVVRQVFQLYEMEDMYINGKPAIPSTLTPWDRLKASIGLGVDFVLNGKRKVILEYSGFIDDVQPLPKLASWIPEFLTKQRVFTMPTPYAYGRDPLPTVRLYKNNSAVFIAKDGGAGLPIAVAKYNSHTHQISMSPSIAHVNQTIADIRRANPEIIF